MFHGTPLTPVRREYYNKFLEYIFDGKIKVEKVVKCLCGSSDFTELNKVDRFGLPFGTKICNSCELISLDRRLCAESLPIYYSDIYWGLILAESSQDGSLSTHGEEYASKLLQFVDEQLKFQRKELNILEIGSGTGEKLKAIKDQITSMGYEVNATAFDYSSEAIESCRDKDLAGEIGGFDEVLKNVQKFDFVILSHVVEHLTNPIEELKKVREFLAEDGLLYIEVPGIFTLKSSADYCFDYNLYCVHAHMYNFSFKTLNFVLREAGFHCLKGNEFVRTISRLSGDYVKQPPSMNSIEDTVNELLLALDERNHFFSSPKRKLKRKLKNILFPELS